MLSESEANTFKPEEDLAGVVSRFACAPARIGGKKKSFMNEVLRLLKKALKPFGYDVSKIGHYTLSPPKSDSDHTLAPVYQAFDHPQKNPSSDVQRLVVFIRTCLRASRNVDKTPRFTGVSVAETIYRCLLSTVASIQNACDKGRLCEVVVLDDHSDAEYVAVLKRIFSRLTCTWTFETTRETGQGLSLLEQFERAKNLNALCYFCEDDYLHLPSAIDEMWSFYQQVFEKTNAHMVLHPQEMEFLYQHYYPSYILKGEYRHWRSMSHATHVLWTHSHVVKDYWRYFENTRFVGDRKNRHKGSENRTTNLLFQHIPGFCPLPGLAGHTQFDFTLPPFFDWKEIWDQCALPELI